jgi:hypothetical protein
MDLPDYNMPFYKEPAGLGAVLVAVTQGISLVVRIVSGGFKSGHLEKSIQFTLDKALLSAFTQNFQLRLAELRFNSGNGAGQFFQGGVNFGELGSFMHAKTSKMLTAQMVESGENQVAVTLTLRYLDPIVADTGECSYRDAVLNYVSGQADQMVVVPNPSLMALNSFIGGMVAFILSLLLLVLGTRQWWQTVYVMALSEAVIGLMALISILRKPKEITGKWQAIAGLALNFASIAVAGFSDTITKAGSAL